MDKIDEILEYVRKSNPGMTREQLIALAKVLSLLCRC